MRKITNKKAAIELSIGTVVVIVIAMSMLILGVVLVRNIFAGATDSVDSLNEGVKAEITRLFAEEGSNVVIRLGSDKLAKVRQGEKIGIGVGGKTNPPPGSTTASAIQRNLQFSVEKVTQQGVTPCAGLTIEGADNTGNLPKRRFDDESGSEGKSIIFFLADENAPECTQRFKLTTYESEGGQERAIASAGFRVEVTSGGILG